MKLFFTSAILSVSFVSFACSCYEYEGFCQGIEGENSRIALGIKLSDFIIYDSTQIETEEHILAAGMSYKVIENLRGNVFEDTITVWTETYIYTCTWGTLEFEVGDTILLKLMPTTFNIDSVESSDDYNYLNTEFCLTNSLRYRNDTLRGLVYADYKNYLDPVIPYHPDVWYHINNVSYYEFKQNILNGLICYDYTSIEENHGKSLVVYPNPCFDILNLKVDNEYHMQFL